MCGWPNICHRRVQPQRISKKLRKLPPRDARVARHATGQDREMGVRCSRHTGTVRLNYRNTPLRCDTARLLSLGSQKTGFGAGTWAQSGVHAQVGGMRGRSQASREQPPVGLVGTARPPDPQPWEPPGDWGPGPGPPVVTIMMARRRRRRRAVALPIPQCRRRAATALRGIPASAASAPAQGPPGPPGPLSAIIIVLVALSVVSANAPRAPVRRRPLRLHEGHAP